MRTYLSILAFLVPLFSTLSLQASVVRGGEKVIIDQPSEENHYLAGGEILVRAPISGDLFGVAGKVEIEAPIGDDVMLGAGDILIRGPVGGDLRVTGGNIVIEQNVGGDLLIAGGEVLVKEGVRIGGDLLLAGGSVSIRGAVAGATRVIGGEIDLRGEAVQSLRVQGGSLRVNTVVRGPSQLVAESINLGSEARFLGNVEYWQEGGEIDFNPYLGEGANARFNPDLRSSGGSSQPSWMFPIYRFLAGALLIVLLVYFFAPFFRKHAGFIPRHFGASLGYGVAYLAVVPLLAILAMITIIGLPVGLILLAGYGITLLLGGALVSVVAAYELERRQQQNWSTGKTILVAIGISLLLRLLAFIPFLGGIIGFLAVAIAFGYLFKVLIRKYNQPTNPDIV